MNFNDEKPIYRQISDWVMDKIMCGEWPENERILSVRELAVLLQVNPNTAMRAYDEMQDAQIIFNRRGIGFFVADGARSRIIGRQRAEFVRETLPALLRRMELLGIAPETLAGLLAKYQSEKPKP